ncbi:hypothetical protein CU669_00130 [Paramagnetospirillum kuznetsovii]|uniref:Uncharacterized protein n=1 Tax=Paramagnetospirillum kuznetsovii TaxID=2053833 RepID=A0A364P2H9_9PROT|nr:hypothetical protein [Paramagnetospirillum kuznetsovii]RAU23552.1 hypothetical protein CU669_00130 [Paramagnetospirillum kuznetsovii]
MSTVYIVHAIDTEGPLYESLQAKFDRLKHLFGIDGLDRTEATLAKLRAGEIDLGDKTEMVKLVLNGHLTNYNATWTQVNAMLDRILAPEFRTKMVDSFGEGWVFNWFCIDLVGYVNNPRRRDLGFHNIYDHFAERLAQDPNCRDGVHFHFHPISTFRDAHYCGTHYLRYPEFFEVLARKVIERGFFPHAFRAGFQAERPDIHWFLEQFIPFDITNMALDDPTELDKTVDFRNGRSGDWRRAPADWSVYRPDHDDYQRPGNCRRAIGRALNIMNRMASIDQREMDKAFARAETGLPTLVGLCSHDHRDIGPEVDHVRDLIAEAQKKYPGVTVKFAEAREAFRKVLWPERDSFPEFELEMRLHPASADDCAYVEIIAAKGAVFGPQPYLAIETRGKRFITDNLDFDTRPGRWFYAFHHDTLPLEEVARVGVGANDAFGSTSVKVLDFR